MADSTESRCNADSQIEAIVNPEFEFGARLYYDLQEAGEDENKQQSVLSKAQHSLQEKVYATYDFADMIELVLHAHPTLQAAFREHLDATFSPRPIHENTATGCVGTKSRTAESEARKLRTARIALIQHLGIEIVVYYGFHLQPRGCTDTLNALASDYSSWDSLCSNWNLTIFELLDRAVRTQRDLEDPTKRIVYLDLVRVKKRGKTSTKEQARNPNNKYDKYGIISEYHGPPVPQEAMISSHGTDKSALQPTVEAVNTEVRLLIPAPSGLSSVRSQPPSLALKPSSDGKVPDRSARSTHSTLAKGLTDATKTTRNTRSTSTVAPSSDSQVASLLAHTDSGRISSTAKTQHRASTNTGHKADASNKRKQAQKDTSRAEDDPLSEERMQKYLKMMSIVVDGVDDASTSSFEHLVVDMSRDLAIDSTPDYTGHTEEWQQQYGSILERVRKNAVNVAHSWNTNRFSKPHFKCLADYLSDGKFATVGTVHTPKDYDVLALSADHFRRFSARGFIPECCVVIKKEHLHDISAVNVNWYLDKLERRYEEFDIQDHRKSNGEPRKGTISEIREHFRSRSGATADEFNLTTSLNLLNLHSIADLSKPSVLTLPRFQALHDLCVYQHPKAPVNTTITCRTRLSKNWSLASYSTFLVLAERFPHHTSTF